MSPTGTSHSNKSVRFAGSRRWSRKTTQAHDLFARVAAEVARVVDVPAVSIASYESDDSVVYLAVSQEGEGFGIGARQPLDGTSVVSEIWRSHEPARIDDYSGLDGSIAEAMRRAGGRSTVGSPIVVAGRLWGAMVVSTAAPEPLPPDTEARLVDFTELLGAAIADAESREALERLAEEQAALRRVATLAARGVHPTEIFSAVSREVAQLFGTNAAYVGRFDPDGPAIVTMGVANWDPETTVGSRWVLDDSMSTAAVFRTGRSARVDHTDWSSVPASMGAPARRMGTSCAVASPITVDGRLWGAVSVASPETLPPDTADRLEKFTELVATAIANAESREVLERVAEEQAALRRAATMVVEGVSPEVIFSAVSDEIGRLFAADTAAVVKFEHDPPSIFVVGVGASMPGIPVGTRAELDDSLAVTQVYRTGRSASPRRAGLGPGPRTLSRSGTSPRPDVVRCEPDHRRGSTVGRDHHFRDYGVPARHRNASGAVQRSPRHRDRERRIASGARGSRRRAVCAPADRDARGARRTRRDRLRRRQ
jgi:GAF domain-containing protein